MDFIECYFLLDGTANAGGCNWCRIGSYRCRYGIGQIGKGAVESIARQPELLMTPDQHDPDCARWLKGAAFIRYYRWIPCYGMNNLATNHYCIQSKGRRMQ